MFQMTPHECAFLQPGNHGSGLWEDPGEPGGPSTRVGNMDTPESLSPEASCYQVTLTSRNTCENMDEMTLQASQFNQNGNSQH